MLQFGDNVGLCLQFQSADDIAGALVDIDLAQKPLSGRGIDKGTLIINKKKQLENRGEILGDQVRVLLYQDGVCSSSTDPHSDNRIILDKSV
jgi:hypothetical protein